MNLDWGMLREWGSESSGRFLAPDTSESGLLVGSPMTDICRSPGWPQLSDHTDSLYLTRVVGGSRVRPSPDFPVPTHKKTYTDHLCPTTDSTREEARGSKRKPLASRQPGGGLRPRPADPQQPGARPAAHAQKARPPRPGPTSTATLKSTMDTLVLRCQHTCTMVLPRCGAWRSSEVRDALRSSSDSWSPAASSGDSAGGGGARRGADISALQEAHRKAFSRLLSGGLRRCRQSLGNPPGQEVTL